MEIGRQRSKSSTLFRVVISLMKFICIRISDLTFKAIVSEGCKGARRGAVKGDVRPRLFRLLDLDVFI